MPDTAEAVAQSGSAVYRLAYAMTNTDVRGSCG